MQDLKARLLRYSVMPPGMLWRKAVRRIKATIVQSLLRVMDRYRSSYSSTAPSGALFLHLNTFPSREARANAIALRALSELYFAHRFDLLGSGWVSVYYGAECAGVEGYRYGPVSQEGVPVAGRVNSANRSESSRLWALLEHDYRPIDWQLDFKSGFRWREDCWYKDIAVETGSLGADIKVPWELARCQHLPQLALAYGLAKAGVAGFRREAEYLREFRNQVIDFIANNPPRFGVNWVCTMDVGIRVANWLIAYDLFVAAGASFDAAFDAELRRSIRAHGKHIASNLEWNEAFRGNHYIADLAGLLFAGAYLPSTAETDLWIKFATAEVLIEISEQFNEDGTNSEASTCYHRLSSELVVYSMALSLSVLRDRLPLPWRIPSTRYGRSKSTWDAGRQIFSENIARKIERAAEFTMHITKKNHRVTQIGDNDSGRFFKLQPSGLLGPIQQTSEEPESSSGNTMLWNNNDYWQEDSLDHRHLVGAIGALFSRRDFVDFAGPFELDAAVIRSLAGGHRFHNYPDESQSMRAVTVRIASDDQFRDIEAKLQALPDCGSQTYRFPLKLPLRKDAIEAAGYPDFGLFIFRSADVYLAVRCGPSTQIGNGSHAHQDQLAVELVMNGHDYVLDPGTYLYTALPERRNEYRAAAAHFVPRVAGMKLGELSELFSLGDICCAECLYFGQLGFIGTHSGFGTPVYRVVAFEAEQIEIRDYAEGKMLERSLFFELAWPNSRYSGPPFSAGYGLRSGTLIKV